MESAYEIGTLCFYVRAFYMPSNLVNTVKLVANIKWNTLDCTKYKSETILIDYEWAIKDVRETIIENNQIAFCKGKCFIKSYVLAFLMWKITVLKNDFWIAKKRQEIHSWICLSKNVKLSELRFAEMD